MSNDNSNAKKVMFFRMLPVEQVVSSIKAVSVWLATQLKTFWPLLLVPL
jgi:hypothetical protein